ncbi:hypothetical protein [Rhodopseudomonas parapalustris]
MFDVSTINKRYFAIKINNIELEVEPPKIKALKKIMSLSKSRNEDAMDNLSDAIKMILSKNRTGFKVADELIDELDFDEMNGILNAYFDWLSSTRNSPN